ncbi:MAG TPA: dynamin family protein, partial [Usitatibacteraceae bacterium]|nr:dynamin family protein [Usitatibacteraceae bacterium]
MRRATFLTERLADMQSWRSGLLRQIERVGTFLRDHRFLTDETAAALDRAEQAVKGLRLTIAFVAEAGRGKTELINALFFAGGGRRLLPAGPGRTTRCVTEIRFDRGVQTSVRLLPIETRENPMRLDDLLADDAHWRVIPFDADNPDSTQRALAALSEAKRISFADAVALGLHAEGVAVPADETQSTMVDVPRWRYAVINFPHPLLDSGLVIIDTPGLAAFTSEPELARQRVPSADAILMLLDANKPVGKADLAIWRDHLGAGSGPQRTAASASAESTPTRLVVLNKIDLLQTPGDAVPDSTRMLMQQIDERTRLTAELLRIDPIRVIAISARLGIAGRLAGEPDSDIRSRLYLLERALSEGLPTRRQDALTATLSPILEDALESAQQMLDDDRFETLERLRELTQLRAKNEKLGASIGSQTTLRQDRLDAALKELRSVRNVHAKLGDQLSSLANVEL